MRLLSVLAALTALVVIGLAVSGYLLDAPQPPPPSGDAIIVISGDEQLARFREGLRLYRAGFGRYLVFSGAARDGNESNAAVMQAMALEAGVPADAILVDALGEDTWGNAVHTRPLLERSGTRSAIVVTSPYHVRRAKLTFEAAYAGSGIQLWVHAAPDSEWRKRSWWQSTETQQLTLTELQKLAYIAVTGRYHLGGDE